MEENRPPKFRDYLNENDITPPRFHAFEYLTKHIYRVEGKTFTTYACSLEHIKRLQYDYK